MRITNKVEIKTSDGHTDFAYDTSAANIIELPHLVEGQRYTGKVIFKLGQLEDIEDGMGIDLVTLFKLVKSKKIYSFGHDNIMENSISGINIYDNTITIWNGYCHSNYPLSEYGKSFALTKEELKK